MSENETLGVEVKAGDRIYIHGPVTTERLWLVPRKWWQFWKPRMVQKYVRLDMRLP